MAKKLTTTQWHKKVWKVFSRYIRLRDYANQVDPEPYIASCFSCGRGGSINGVGCLQAGHFITRSKKAILYDEKNVHAQCVYCNKHQNGNWDGYYDEMLRRYGQEIIDDLMNRRFNEAGFNTVMLEELYDHYTSKLGKLTDIHGNPFK